MLCASSNPFERVSVHEAGHILVGLSLGITVDKVDWNEKAESPALETQGFKSSISVEFDKSIHELEPRRQFLIALGGMAGETLKFGFYEKSGAAADLDSLNPNVLTEQEIHGLVEIGQLLILPNLSLYARLRPSLYSFGRKEFVSTLNS